MIKRKLTHDITVPTRKTLQNETDAVRWVREQTASLGSAGSPTEGCPITEQPGEENGVSGRQKIGGDKYEGMGRKDDLRFHTPTLDGQ